jgi:hypothetical protein
VAVVGFVEGEVLGEWRDRGGTVGSRRGPGAPTISCVLRDDLVEKRGGGGSNGDLSHTVGAPGFRWWWLEDGLCVRTWRAS